MTEELARGTGSTRASKPSRQERWWLRLVAIATGTALASVGQGGWEAAADPLQDEPYTTATSVEALGTDFSGVGPFSTTGQPYGRPSGQFDNGQEECQKMNVADGPLGYFGPIGSWGPLSDLGPLGLDRAPVFPWPELPSLVDPLGPNGALGSSGPLAAYNGSAYNPATLAGGPHDYYPCGVQLKAGGVFAPNGPLGPLGAVGPLGPLGPLGAVKFDCPPDSEGNYRCDGQVTRVKVGAARDDGTRPYGLFEKYTKRQAQLLNDETGDKANDTSFMVVDTPEDGGRVGVPDDYTFTSPATLDGIQQHSQWLTVVVTPTGMEPEQWEEKVEPNDYTLTLRDVNSGREWTSDSSDRINWIHIRVPANARLTASVTLRTDRGRPHGYDLTVTGSTHQFQYLGCNPDAADVSASARYVYGAHLMTTQVQGSSTVGAAPECSTADGAFDHPIG